MSFRGKRRWFVNLFYSMIEKKEGFLMVVQEIEIEEEEYLTWKLEVQKSGGLLSRWTKEELDLLPFSFLFGGRNFFLYWPNGLGLKKYQEWKKKLEDKNCFVLCVMDQGVFFYEEVWLMLQKKRDQKIQQWMGEVKKIPFWFLNLRRSQKMVWYKLRRYADVTSIKEKS